MNTTARRRRATISPHADRQLVSVVIINYNYGRYLSECIESVLVQDYAPMEVIVVDDGSTDDSRAIIESYSGHIVASFKQNGGVISATNHGFQLSHGSVVIFVDADDYLLPGAVATHAGALREAGVVRSQVYLTVLVGDKLSSSRIPGVRAPEGDLREQVLHKGPGAYVSSPTSGNAWSRTFLERIFPLPEQLRGLAQDTLLMDAAPLFGKIVTLDRCGAAYRLHDDNRNGKLSAMTPENIRSILAQHDARIAWLARVATSLGHKPCAAEWRSVNWRLLTLQYLISRFTGGGEPPAIADNLRPVFEIRGNRVKRSLLAFVILCIRLAPMNLSFYIASRVIKLRYM